MAIPSYFKRLFREYVTGVGSSEVADQAPVQSVNSKTGDVTINVPVDQVNGQTGDVTLSASDVNALADTYSAPVQSVNSKTGDVSIPTGSSPAAVVQTYDDLPLQNVTERELYYVDNATDGDFVYPTQLDPVRWVSLSDYALVASYVPDSGVTRLTLDSSDTNNGNAIDVWGNRDATINGATTGVTGANQTYTTNEAYDFDGVDDNLTDTDFDVSAGSLSVAIWINADFDTTNTDSPRFFQWQVDGYNNFEFLWDGNNSQLAWAWSNNFPGATYSPSSIQNTWIHLVGVYDSGAGEQRFYVDGTQEATASTGADNSGTGTIAYGSFSNGSQFLDGKLDDIRFYDKALSDTEVSDLYNTGSI